MSITFFRNKTQRQFTIIDKSILSNMDLSLKDRGMLATLLSLPDYWDFSINGLSKILPDGKSSIAESLKRIEQKGFLARRIIRDKNGKYSRYELEIYEIPRLMQHSNLPYTDNRDTATPKMEKLNTDFQSQYSNNLSITKKCINKESKNELSDTEYNELVFLHGKEIVDYQISKIKSKGYKGCLNKKTIEQWCNDYNKNPSPLTNKNQFHNFDQREYSKNDYESIEHAIINKCIEEVDYL